MRISGIYGEKYWGNAQNFKDKILEHSGMCHNSSNYNETSIAEVVSKHFISKIIAVIGNDNWLWFFSVE